MLFGGPSTDGLSMLTINDAEAGDHHCVKQLPQHLVDRTIGQWPA